MPPRRRPFIFACLLLMSTPIQAKVPNRDYPGWTISSATSGSPGSETDLIFACRGEGCAANTLQCTLFRRRAPTDSALDVDALTDPLRFPLGQLSLWQAASLMNERRDLFSQVEVEAHSPPLALSLREMEGRKFAWSQVEIVAGKTVIGVQLALWLDRQSLQGLRCSHREGGAENALDARVLDFLRMVLIERR